MERPTMLTKAERNTRVMVNTPTRVLFFLDRTIFLESVCRGVGKSWGRQEGKKEETKQKSVRTLQTDMELRGHTPFPGITPWTFLNQPPCPQGSCTWVRDCSSPKNCSGCFDKHLEKQPGDKGVFHLTATARH